MPRIKNWKIAKRRRELERKLGVAASGLGDAYPQPAIRPVQNNRTVFIAGLLTGFAIGVCLYFFVSKMLEVIL